MIFDSRTIRLAALICMAALPAVSRADLENHYTFDDPENVTADSSGNDRHGALDDFEVGWVDDEVRGGVLEFGGNTNGFVLAEVPDLVEGFTIMMWAYRDPDLCCGAGGANDGLFQVQLGTDDIENLPLPSTSEKVIGGWVQKSDAALWGRVIDINGANNLPQGFYYMDDEVWTHLAYRSDGETFEVVIDGVSGEGPFLDYDGETLLEHDQIYIGRQGTETWGGRLDDFRVYSGALTDEEIMAIMEGGGMPPGLLGDFNNSGALDVEDMDLLTGIVIEGTNDVNYDLNNDAVVNQEDRRVWIEDLSNSYFGDANLDKEFNSGDLVAVLAAGTYEVDVDSTWASGDFDGNKRTNTNDLVAALAGGGYEQGPRPAVSAVPEPSSAVLLLLGMLCWRRPRRS